MADEWLSDANGNRCSVAYFGSREAAQAALGSLKNCRDCVNCSYCSRCSGCSGCSGCSYCSGCSRCSGCSGCSYCSRCSYCSDCSGCSRCSRCSGCSDCSDCSDCSGCSEEKGETGSDAPPPVPTIPDIHKRIYEAASAPGALDMGSWHTCEQTHCRAGWTVALAGPEGRALEAYYDTPLAAMLIYQASGYEISPPRFFETNELALADMKRLAEGA